MVTATAAVPEMVTEMAVMASSTAAVVAMAAAMVALAAIAPYWYTQSEETSIIEIRHVLQSGLQLKEICTTNKLPQACNRLEATRKNAGKISMQEHETIMEEAERCDRLEYNNNNGSEEDEGKDSDDKEDECMSDLEL